MTICEACGVAEAKKTLPVLENLRTVERRFCPNCFVDALTGLVSNPKNGDRTRALVGFRDAIDYLLANPRARVTILNIAWVEDDDDDRDDEDDPPSPLSPITLVPVPIE